MKKVSYLFLVLGLAFSSIGIGALAADTPTSTAHSSISGQTTDPRSMQPVSGEARSSLEKIPHPDYIKYFQGIQRIGSALWGVRKSETGSNTSEKKISSDYRCPDGSTGTRCGTTEKNMKKPEHKTENRPFVKIDPVIAQCVKTAIERKDTTLKASLLTYQTAVMSAIDARTTCQKAAIDLTSASEQQTANKNCIETYHRAVWNALTALKSSKESGWKTFRTDVKACGSQAVDANKNEVLVEDGEMQINLEVDMEDDSTVSTEKTTENQMRK